MSEGTVEVLHTTRRGVPKTKVGIVTVLIKL